MKNNSQLTEKQWAFVNEYMINGRNATEAARKTLDAKNSYIAGYKMVTNNKKVMAEIAKREETLRRTTAKTEEECLDRMWIEATREGKGAQHSARIAALVKYAEWVNHFKHIREKEGEDDKGGLSVSIINYGNGEKREKVIEATKEAISNATKEEIEEASDLSGIEITDYS